MGMTCTLRRLPEGELERLLALSPDDASAFLRAQDEEASSGDRAKSRSSSPSGSRRSVHVMPIGAASV